MLTSDRTVEFVTTLPSMTAVAFCGLFLRFFCKIKYGRPVMLDDSIMAMAWMLTMSSLCCLLAAVIEHGYTLHHKQRAHFPQGAAYLVAISQGLTSTSGATAKASIALTLWRVSPLPWHKFVLKTTTAITILSTIVTAVVISLNINDGNLERECLRNSTVWRFGVFSAVWGVISDFILSGLPWFMIWNLHMRKAEKYGLGVTLSLGCVTGILGIMKLSYINCVSVLLPDDSYNSVDLVTYHFVEPTVIITAACLPALRFFLAQTAARARRSSARASELLDFTAAAAAGGRLSVPPCPCPCPYPRPHPRPCPHPLDSISSSLASLPVVGGGGVDGDGTGELLLLPPLAPVRYAPVSGVRPRPRPGGGGPGGGGQTTVTTISGRPLVLGSSASSGGLPGEGQIVKTTRVVVREEVQRRPLSRAWPQLGLRGVEDLEAGEGSRGE